MAKKKKKVRIHETEQVTLVSRKWDKVYVKQMMYKNALELYKRRDGVRCVIYQVGFSSLRSNVESRDELLKAPEVPLPPPVPASPAQEFVPPPPPQ
jgi:hypothetical protein